jgi:TRAP-type mannitol/chloroaromatic compound transport system substrate-binding protein
MSRREFLKRAGVGAALGVAAAPAIAQTQPTVRWRLQTSWPKSLDTTHGGVEAMARRVGAMTEGKFEIRVMAAGELVPGNQVFDAVAAGTFEATHTLSTFFIGKNPAFTFDSGIPFGLNARQQAAWFNWGGGAELLRDVFKPYGLINFPCGNTGVQMGGWYRKEIKTVQDLKGLKMRIGGIGGSILTKLGVTAQQLPPGDIYAALEKGTIDAAEFIGPHDDEKLGLNKVAKFYYYPGWWEGSAQNTMLVNLKAWEALPKPFQEALECAAHEQDTLMTASYDAKNPIALKKLVGAGTQLRAFPKAVMDACYKASEETMAELGAKSADFKKIHEQWTKFRDDQNLWFRVAENTLDAYRYAASGAASAAAAKK